MSTQHTPKRGRHFYGPGPYVEREADDALFEALRAGEYAIVFGPRGSGKTSLRMHVGQRLVSVGVAVAVVDLGAIGAETRADAFCASVVIEAGRSLGLAEEAKRAWRRSKGPPQMRLRACIREVILDGRTGPVVLFIDELELVRALGPARDDFFAALRAMADSRANDDGQSPWRHLSVCLIGALTRDELVSDPRRSAFDLPARELAPRDFSREQFQAFAPALDTLGADTKAVLDSVYEWTSGHPALCQWIAGDLLLREVGRGAEASAVEAVVRESFLQRGPEVDPLLGDTARRLRRDQLDPWRTRVLAVYERVLRGESIDLRGRQLGADGSLIVARLKIAGLVAASAGGKLRVRNKITERAFDRSWVRKALTGRPVSEALERWESGGRRAAALLRGQALSDAIDWVEGRPDVTPGERDFVLASERGRAHRLRSLLWAGSALSLGLAGLLGLALWQYGNVLDTPVRAAAPSASAGAAAGDDGRGKLAAADERGSESSLVDTITAVDQASRIDVQLRETEALRGQLEVLREGLAVEQAQRAQLLAPDPRRRAEGSKLALTAIEPWAEAPAQAPAPVTRALTINLPAAGDILEIDAHDQPIQRLAASRGRGVSVASLPSADPSAPARGAELRVWDLATGRRVANLESPAGELVEVAISPAGQWVAALSRVGSLTVWRLDDGSALGPAPIPAPAGVVTGLAPVAELRIDDGGGVSLLRRDGAIDRVDPQAGNASARVRGSALPDELPLSLATVQTGALDFEAGADFLARGAGVALVNVDTLEIWDPPSGHTLASVPAPPLPTGVRELVWVPDGRRVLVWAHAARSLIEWSLDSGALRTITEHESPLVALEFSRGGQLMATGTQAGVVRLWSADGTLLAEDAAHAAPISALAFTRGGLLSADRAGGLRMQPLSKRDRPAPVSARLGAQGAALTAALQRIESGTTDVTTGETTGETTGATTSTRLWFDGLDRLGLVAPLDVPGVVTRVESDLDARHLAVLLDDGRAALLTRARPGESSESLGEADPEAPPGEDPAPYTVLAGEDGRVLDLTMSSDGSLLALAGEDRRISLWTGAGDPIATLAGHQAPVERLALSPSGARLASADRSQIVRVWDPGTAALLATLETERRAAHLALVEAHLVLVDSRGVAELWSLETRERTAEIDLGTELNTDRAVTALALSEDGQLLAVGRTDGVELWHVETGEAYGRFRVSPPVLALRFVDPELDANGQPGPSPRSLLAVDGRGVLGRWSVSPQDWLVTACDALPVATILPAACPVDD